MNNLTVQDTQRRWLRYALSLSPGIAAKKAAKLAARLLYGYSRQILDHFRQTYVKPLEGELSVQPANNAAAGLFAPSVVGAMVGDLAGDLSGLTKRYLEHRFGLLGSGWVRVEHGMTCNGFEGIIYPACPVTSKNLREYLVSRLSPGNRGKSRHLWAMVDKTYVPIDWQIDFKSGYRWDEGKSSATVLYGHLPGVDIKIPWELARLQHFPRLALAYVMSRNGEGGFQPPEIYINEFRNQSLDFIASNPPRFGVNWACTMDIAIRAANMVMAMYLFRRHGAVFDNDFEAEFAASILGHARHINDNPERHGSFTGNHYLAGLAGLGFCAAILPATGETNGWLCRVAKELVSEVASQFHEDGANFEASTSYHRLSAEMVVFTTALIIGLDDRRKREIGLSSFPEWYFERIEKMAEFSLHITKPNGRVAQIGDNDNGRLFKLSAAAESGVSLDHRSLVGAINGLFERDDLATFSADGGRIEAALVNGLAGGATVASYLDANSQPAAVGRQLYSGEQIDGTPKSQRKIIIKPPDSGVLDNLIAVSYPDFGLYIWRSGRFFLSLRCGPIGQNSNGGHAHNDQLAIELNIDGDDWLADPGSYVYTASPELRNRYRSVHAHAAPRYGNGEPSRMDLGMFRLGDEAKAKCLRFDEKGFHGIHHGFGIAVFRTVEIDKTSISITEGTVSTGPTDTSDCETITVEDRFRIREISGDIPPFSPGYGRME